MSYQEKNINVTLMSHFLILGFYLLNMIQMLQAGHLTSITVFSLWGTVIVTTILANIIASILTHIVFNIIHAIKTNSDREEPDIADERDKLFELKGLKASYITFSIGVLLAMLTFVFGQPPLVMFSMIIFFSIAAEIIGGILQIYYYRRGF